MHCVEVLPWFGTTGFLLMSLSSAAHDMLTTLMIGLSLLWEMMLWISVSVILEKQSCIRYSKRRKFRPKMRQNAFGGRTPPLGELNWAGLRTFRSNALLFPGTIETTIQSAVYTVVEVTDDSRPLRRTAFYMEISNNDLGQFYHTERPHLRIQHDARMQWVQRVYL